MGSELESSAEDSEDSELRDAGDVWPERRDEDVFAWESWLRVCWCMILRSGQWLFACGSVAGLDLLCV